MARPRPLDEAALAAELARTPGWQRQGQEIRREFRWATFGEAMAFANRVAELAERRDHHPDILVQHSRVTLTLSTHDAGGLTELDFRLAREIGA